MANSRQRITIPLVGQEAKSKTVTVSESETVNFMQAMKGEGAKAPYILETVPGTVDRAGSYGDGPIRSSKMVNSKIRGTNDLYGVFGTKLVAMTILSGNFEIGTLNNNPGRVEMARGRSYIAMVDGTNGYTYDGSTFAVISDLDFPGTPTHIVYLDGFFIVNDADTDNFYISGLEDPTSWNALDFEAASVAPDAALALAATESLLWILGDETSQAFYNDGNQDFPYANALSATQEVGILAPYTLAESDDGIFFLATTPEGGRFIYRIQGQSGQVITMDEQEALLADIVDPADCYAFIYKQAGKSFYVLQIGQLNGRTDLDSATLVYNIRAQRWERRETQGGTAWRAGGYGVLGGENIVGSNIAAQAYTLELTNYQDAGQELIRRRRGRVGHNNNYLMDWWEFIVDCTVATTEDPNASPEMKLRYSDDGGRTWSSWMTRSVGAIGETKTRLVWNNLGQSRDRIIEIEYSENTDMSILAAYAVVQPTSN